MAASPDSMRALSPSTILGSPPRHASIQTLESTKITLFPHRTNVRFPFGKRTKTFYQAGSFTMVEIPLDGVPDRLGHCFGSRLTHHLPQELIGNVDRGSHMLILTYLAYNFKNNFILSIG